MRSETIEVSDTDGTEGRRPVRTPFSWIAYQSRRVPSKIAIVDLESGRERTYAEMADRVARLAGLLNGMGLKRGDRIAILSHNDGNVFELLYACAMVGMIMVPLNWRLSTPELHAIVDDFTPAALFHDVEHAAVGAELAQYRDMTTVGWGDHDDEYERAIASAAPTPPRTDLSEDEPWVIIYTSGTTGQPKGAVHSFRSVRANIDNSAFAGDVHAESVVLSVLPTFHVAGLHLYADAALIHGATMLIMRSFDPKLTLRLFDDTRRAVTHFCGVPAMYQFMAADPLFDQLTLRPILATVGGSPVPAAMVRTWRDRGIDMMPIYGITEAGSSLLSMPPGFEVTESAVGVPVIHAEARIHDPEGRELGPGEVGELWLRGPMTMLEYWGKPEETANAVTAAGWLRTGDAARVDEHGVYHIIDRWKDMYISGGENVYPAEVENVLYQHPSVVLATVVGIPHNTWGETGRAFVVVSEGTRLGADELRAWCRDRLAAFKVPLEFVFRDDLPRNATGKIMKKALRDKN